MPKQFSRREAAKLIGTTAAGVFLPVGAAQVFAAAGESARLILRAIPSTGEKLPVMGLGSALTFDVRGSAAERTVGEVIALFVKQGGKLIDTSPAYGNAESLIGDLAYKAGLTKSLFIATKVWSRDKLQGLAQMEKSLERFRTRTIDLIQVHNLADVDRQMTSLNSLKAKGRIRYTGLTHSERKGHGEMERAMRVHKPDFIQINYSLMERAAAQRILPLAREMGIGVIINRPFSGGGIFQILAGKKVPAWTAEFDCHSWAQFLLKWIVSHPAVTCVIPATNEPKHLVDNMGAGVGRLPDAKTRERMASLFVGF